jgi:hypothetical protein
LIKSVCPVFLLACLIAVFSSGYSMRLECG